MLSAIFEPPQSDLDLQDLRYDAHESPQQATADTYINTAKSRLVALMEMRGASELPVDLLMPICPHYYKAEDGRRPVKFVDEDGAVVR